MLVISPECPGPQYPWWASLCARCPNRWFLPQDRPIYLRVGSDLMPAPKWRTWPSCWTLARDHRPSDPCPVHLPWEISTPGAGTRARNSWRPTAIRIPCPWGAGPGRRSGTGGTCNALNQRDHPWAPPPPGPQLSPGPPRWAPTPRPAGRSSTHGRRRKPGRTPQRRRDHSRGVSPLSTPGGTDGN